MLCFFYHGMILRVFYSFINSSCYQFPVLLCKITPMLRKFFFNLAYLGRPVWDTGISPPELTDFIATHPAGWALDLGCGTGTNVVTLAKHGWSVTGVDFTPRAIRMARQKVQQNGVQAELRVDDVTRLHQLSGRYNLVLDMGCYHSLAPGKRPVYLANVRRLLADDGTFLLYTFTGSGFGRTGPGSSEEDFRLIDQELHIVKRKDSTERGYRPSAWLTIMKRMHPTVSDEPA